ncbi:hypothetical protein [Helicobacter bilis]|uniref:hypothetical protein n=1 Tax=Helicobacter bilis TaxID=37372 RepID=UPI00248F2BFA|nr:hypothetical protein [Helicobacter bilis]
MLKDQLEAEERKLYDYAVKYNAKAETLGLTSFDKEKLEHTRIRQSLKGITDPKELNKEQKEYLEINQGFIDWGYDKVFTKESKHHEELLRNETRKEIKSQALNQALAMVSSNTSLTDIFRGKEHSKEQRQTILNEGQELAKKTWL